MLRISPFLGCMVADILCPNQFAMSSRVMYPAADGVPDVFNLHEKCPNYFYGKTVGFSFIQASIIMNKDENDEPTGLHPVWRHSNSGHNCILRT